MLRTHATSLAGPGTRTTLSVAKALYSPGASIARCFPSREIAIRRKPYPGVAPIRNPEIDSFFWARKHLTDNSRLYSAAIALLRAFPIEQAIPCSFANASAQ